MIARLGSRLLHQRIARAARLAEEALSADSGGRAAASNATSKATTTPGSQVVQQPDQTPAPVVDRRAPKRRSRSFDVTPQGGVDIAALNASLHPWESPAKGSSAGNEHIDSLFSNKHTGPTQHLSAPSGETKLGGLGSFPTHSSDLHQAVLPTLQSRLEKTFDGSGVRAAWVFTFSDTPDFVASHSEAEEFGTDRVKRLVARTVGRAAPLLEKHGERMIHADLGAGCRLYCRKVRIAGANHIIGMAGAKSDMSTATLNPLVASLQDVVATDQVV